MRVVGAAPVMVATVLLLLLLTDASDVEIKLCSRKLENPHLERDLVTFFAECILVLMYSIILSAQYRPCLHMTSFCSHKKRAGSIIL